MLLVPVLKDSEREGSDHDPAEDWARDTWETDWDAESREPEHPDPAGEVPAPPPADAPPADAATGDTPPLGMPAVAEERGLAEAPATPPPDDPAPAPAPAQRTRGGRPPVGRVIGFVVLLVGLALAGLLFGRMLRDSGDESGGAKPATGAATTRPKAPVSLGERWGPLKAAPAGRLAGPAVRAAAAPSGTRVAVLGGTAGNAVQLGAAGGVLRPVASLPSARASAAAFGGDGAVFLIGGERGTETPTDEILRFDLASHKVTQAGSFIEPLAGAGYAQSGRAWYLAGGWTGETFATAILRVSLPDATLVARLPEALRDPAVALRAGKLYVAGGRGESGLTDQVYVVDLASGTVSVLGRLPQPVAGAALVAAAGRLYLLGGRAASGPVAAVVTIDPTTGRIARAGQMPRPLAGAATVQAGASALVIGGTRPTAVFRVQAG